MAFYENVLLKALSQLQHGKIELKYDGQSHLFGNIEKQSSPFNLSVQVEIHDPRCFKAFITETTVGLGRTYAEGQWSCNDLTALLRILIANIHLSDDIDKRWGWLIGFIHRIKHLFNRNSIAGSKANIHAHYDLGNALFEHILDPYMQYSSAIFNDSDMGLDEAQVLKMHSICQRLQLTPQDNVLEIGSGWGGLACFAAKHYGCTVTTVTISEEQFKVAQQRILDQGLSDKVSIKLKDYRDIDGQFDKIFSIEMVEAVGHRYQPIFFDKLDQLLKDDGAILLQGITIIDQRYHRYLRKVDFIRQYIFPGGSLISVAHIAKLLQSNTNMSINALVSFGEDYARTLRLWSENMTTHKPAILALGYDDFFYRLWQFYFCYCEAGFKQGLTNVVHLHITKNQFEKAFQDF